MKLLLSYNLESVVSMEVRNAYNRFMLIGINITDHDHKLVYMTEIGA